MMLETAFADGQLAALQRHKLAFPAPTNPTVANSAVLSNTAPKGMSETAQTNMQPPTTPFQVSQIFDAHEQGKTRTEPRRKLSADDLCTSCRKMKHYGPCNKPRQIAAKIADFNPGLRGDDPVQSDNPSTSAQYHSATSADSALARARDGRPADEQARSLFADLWRGNSVNGMADEPGQMSGSLAKVAQFMLTPTHERVGPTTNPYEERLMRSSTPVGWGDEGAQRIDRAFDQIDHAADSTSIEDASKGAPSGGPAVLG